MDIRIIIQARMGSDRLRGKTLSHVNGIPLLKRVYDAACQLDISNNIIIVTSRYIEDDPIDSYCSKYLNCSCQRGDSKDVLSRFLNVCEDQNCDDIIIRITADNIFYQKNICKELLRLHRENNNDYTGIRGLSHVACEIIKTRALKRLLHQELNEYDCEHVTNYIINNPKIFKIELIERENFRLIKEYDKLLTIDTDEDRSRIEIILKYLDNNNKSYSRENLYDWINIYNDEIKP
jgi:spore coat polysaccharide biosynthesis protein SpsF